MDNGGWASIGSVPKAIKCPKCGADARMLELTSVIYGKVTTTPNVFCNSCGGTSPDDDAAPSEQ